MPDDRLMEIVETVSARPPGEQQAAIREACAGDAALEALVMDYVKGKQLGDFLEGGAFHLCPPDEDYFRPGDVLLNRFQILQEAGRGGMGIVYEAFDRVLDKRVALKCAHSGFDRQLVPEVKNASEISHPNVCRIFNIHHVRTADGDEVSFISMEYLNGPTLADRIRNGPAPEPEAKKIAVELCRGLSAAHRNRVIHGDLKTNNIMLAEGPDGAMRAVITDFGLARHGEPGPGVTSGARGGAPLFMAPELRRGERPTVATDIYALGVVLHQLISGCLPINGRLSAKAPPKWRAVISRMLESDPARRYQSTDEIARALDPAPQPWLSAGAGTILLAMTLWPWPPRDQVRLAVLPFSASNSARGAAERLYSDVCQRVSRLRGDHAKTLRWIPDERLRREEVDTPEEARIRLGATHVLTANVLDAGGRYVIEAAVVDIATGTKSKTWTADYAEEELPAAPVALAGVVSGGLHLPEAAAEPLAGEVLDEYKRGLELARESTSAGEALAVFERIAAQAPHAAAVPAGAAEACFRLHYSTGQAAWLDRAGDYVRQAERINPDTPEVCKARGYLHAMNGHPHAAIPDYVRAVEQRPSDSSLLRRLGLAYEMTDQHEEAQRAFRDAIACDPKSSRPHQELGSYYYRRANYPEAVGCFRKAAELAPQSPDAHYALGAALVNSGEFTGAEEEFRASAGLGDSAKVQNSLGVVLLYQRREAEAIPHFRRALEHDPELELALLNWSIAARRMGRGADSARAGRQGLNIAERKLAANPQDGYQRALVANLAAASGDRRRAELEAAQAARSLPYNNLKRWKLVATYELLGSREEALRTLSEAPLPLLEDATRWPEYEGLAADPRFQSLLASARMKEARDKEKK